MEEKFNFEQTLPVLSRPWPSDAPHPDYAPVDPNETKPIQPYQQPQAQLPPVPTPAPPPAPTPATAPKSNRNAPAKVRKPRKANTNASGTSTLFWVNSDPQTAAEGTKEETLKRIRSHVMSEHNRKKRMESTKQYSKDKWKQMPYQTPAGALVPAGAGSGPARASISSSASLAGTHVSDETELEQYGMGNTLVPCSGYPAVSGASGWDEGNQSYGGASTYPSIWSRVGQGANDPFNTGHTQLTDRMMRHLRVCELFLCQVGLDGCLRSTDTGIVLWDLTQEAHPLQTRYKPKLQAHWASLIQRDPAILHATICMATSNDAMRAGELPIRDPNQKRSQLVIDTFHHRGETIRLVNEGLSDPVKASSDVLIAAVSTLLTIEVSVFNMRCEHSTYQIRSHRGTLIISKSIWQACDR
jgi:hypothetical protein